ncbi:uncharacterized protein LOC125500357 isoform X2 [Athalia rosae]|nr:uncharacterized protein LOC125500357 isoform X2 [Athalia rosae]
MFLLGDQPAGRQRHPGKIQDPRDLGTGSGPVLVQAAMGVRKVHQRNDTGVMPLAADSPNVSHISLVHSTNSRGSSLQFSTFLSHFTLALPGNARRCCSQGKPGIN